MGGKKGKKNFKTQEKLWRERKNLPFLRKGQTKEGFRRRERYGSSQLIEGGRGNIIIMFGGEVRTTISKVDLLQKQKKKGVKQVRKKKANPKEKYKDQYGARAMGYSKSNSGGAYLKEDWLTYKKTIKNGEIRSTLTI